MHRSSYVLTIGYRLSANVVRNEFHANICNTVKFQFMVNSRSNMGIILDVRVESSEKSVKKNTLLSPSFFVSRYVQICNVFC